MKTHRSHIPITSSSLANQLPEAVVTKASASGHKGEVWLEKLPTTLQQLCAKWSLRTGNILHGGTESLVIEASCADASAAVLKIALPETTQWAREAAAYGLGNSDAYAKLIAYDEKSNALLLERLGQPICNLNLSAQQEMQIICATLKNSWVKIDKPTTLISGTAKADYLADFIAQTWQQLNQPCSVAVKQQALNYIKQRKTAHNKKSAVLVHGDAHSNNTLAVPGKTNCYKLVDPDGLYAEPAYDLAIPMREYNEELSGPNCLSLGKARCEFLSTLTGVSTVAIWQWGFIERVSTGLYQIQLGWQEEGKQTLAIAQQWLLPY